MSPSFEVRLDREAFKPGDTVAGTIVVARGGRSRSVSVTLDLVEKTDDYSEVAGTVASGPIHEGTLEDGAALRFELVLPPDAPPNLESKHGALYWQLDVKSDRLGRDTHERRRLVVGP